MDPDGARYSLAALILRHHLHSFLCSEMLAVSITTHCPLLGCKAWAPAPSGEPSPQNKAEQGAGSPGGETEGQWNEGPDAPATENAEPLDSLT